MDFLLTVWQFIGNLDDELALLLFNYGGWIYLILFLIIFCETGLVVAPFLPGDSLLFASGALWAAADMPVELLALTLITAVVLRRQLQLLDRPPVRKPGGQESSIRAS